MIIDRFAMLVAMTTAVAQLCFDSWSAMFFIDFFFLGVV
jgi:hypothetical protein